MSVYFTPTFKLIEKLLIPKKVLKLEKVNKKFDKFDVVIIDDIGYLQQNRGEMEFLFILLADRYQLKSLKQIFKDPTTTMPAVDRFVHHSTILKFSNESFRAREAKNRKA